MGLFGRVLRAKFIKGKEIALCKRFDGIGAASGAGATGSIVDLENTDTPRSGVSLVVPVALSGFNDLDFQLVKSYTITPQISNKHQCVKILGKTFLFSKKREGSDIGLVLMALAGYDPHVAVEL
ncbi:hypothetical protein OROMI_011577 [Orobanche minor]